MGEILHFQPKCWFCDDVETDDPTPTAHVTFKSDHEGFVCEEHLERSQKLDQLTDVRLVQTGINRVMERYAA